MSAVPQWVDRTYRRASVDMHIPDWDPAMLSRFDAESFAENLKRSGAQSHLQMCNSHAGFCLWQSSVGQPHHNMGRRDFIAELSAACQKRDIRFIAYFSLGFDCLMVERYPHWRVQHRFPNGWWYDNCRAGNCCFNSPGYRRYVMTCIDELAGGAYPIDGMFFDMPFWIAPCYCRHCVDRFRLQASAEPPLKVDWDDPTWRQWQKFREESLLEFVAACTRRVKKHDSGYSVSHNQGTALSNWLVASPLEIAEYCDYVSGDFYGEPVVHSLACKVFSSLSKSPRFELATSRTRAFSDHVTIKSIPEMRAEAFIASLHSAALLLIDYVNVDGTLNDAVYDFLAPLNAERAAFEPLLGGQMLADVAIYFDKSSLYDPAMNGLELPSLPERYHHQGPSLHRDALVGAAKHLQQAHVPFGVVTNITLDQLSRYRTVILPNVLEMTAEQAEVFRQFVASGGTLYASGPSSLDRINKRFLLEDVLGIRYVGPLGYEQINYLTPDIAELKKHLWPQDHVSHMGEKMIQVEALPGTEVLARVTLPFVDPALGKAIGQRFAAFHSNPPALKATEHPGITRHQFGKGEAIWVSVPIEKLTEETNRRLLGWLLGKLRNYPATFELDGHHSLEMTVHDQPENSRMIAALLNMSPPPAPALGAAARVRIPQGRQIKQIRLAPKLEPVEFTVKDGMAEFQVTPFDCFRMYVVDYLQS